jgi:hypothetical protein
MVWLSARRDFTFKGTSYASGDVFQVAPLVAVQMKAARLVTFAKAPPVRPEAESREPTPTRRRVRRTSTSTDRPVDAPPEGPQNTEVLSPPAAETAHADISAQTANES